MEALKALGYEVSPIEGAFTGRSGGAGWSTRSSTRKRATSA